MSNKKNGALLAAMKARGFTTLTTVDEALPRQHNLVALQIGVVLLVAPTNTPEDILPLAPKVREALSRIQPGEVIEVRSARL